MSMNSLRQRTYKPGISFSSAMYDGDKSRSSNHDVDEEAKTPQ